jgi:hypothetical protein
MMHTWLIRGVSTVLLGCLGEAKTMAILMTTTSNTADMRQFFAAARSNGISYVISKKQIYVVAGLFRYRAWITAAAHVFTYLRPNIHKIFVAARSI